MYYPKKKMIKKTRQIQPRKFEQNDEKLGKEILKLKDDLADNIGYKDTINIKLDKYNKEIEQGVISLVVKKCWICVCIQGNLLYQ